MKLNTTKAKSTRQKRVSELIREVAAQMITRETNGTSLVTVTNVDISPDLKQCTVYVTVFPEDASDSALNFLKRKRKELKAEVRKKSNMRNVPFFDFDIDQGEKNRQKIEEIYLRDQEK